MLSACQFGFVCTRARTKELQDRPCQSDQSGCSSLADVTAVRSIEHCPLLWRYKPRWLRRFGRVYPLLNPAMGKDDASIFVTIILLIRKPDKAKNMKVLALDGVMK